ncbi:MAG: hypothetical protein MRY83_11490, partial [Flavobacteriales bacterium]|nr:hypothetical protein [Flavobacteriales bacterium]
AWLRARDAYFFTAGLDYNDLHAKISYDVNFSNLTPASQRRGGFEIGVIYIIRKAGVARIPYKICPDYI